MPRYVIERQYLVPIFEHIFVEAPDLETACREALDDLARPWGEDAKLDYDNSRQTTIAQVVEIPEGVLPELRSAEDADSHVLSEMLYESGLDLLPIPSDSGDPERKPETAIGFA